MQFATGDGRAAGRIGAVLVLDAGPGFSVAEARRVLLARTGLLRWCASHQRDPEISRPGTGRERCGCGSVGEGSPSTPTSVHN